MKEFNKKVEELLKESSARIQEIRPMEMIAGPSNDVDYSYPFTDTARTPGNVGALSKSEHPGHRCEICDYVPTIQGSTYRDLSARNWTFGETLPGYQAPNRGIEEGLTRVSYDVSSDRHLCNHCRGVANSAARMDFAVDLEDGKSDTVLGRGAGSLAGLGMGKSRVGQGLHKNLSPYDHQVWIDEYDALLKS